MDMKHKVLSGDEPFEVNGCAMRETVKDFWAWSMSRLIADGPRGDLAEYIINTALGVDTSFPKHGWGEYDVPYHYGDKKVCIEVKCSSYLQAWERATPAKPMFSIAKTIGNDVKEDDFGYYFSRENRDMTPRRRSDVYVFCLFSEKTREKANPLVLDQWQFYIVPTKFIDEKLGNLRRISLAGIERLGVTPIRYTEIKPAIDAIAETL